MARRRGTEKEASSVHNVTASERLRQVPKATFWIFLGMFVGGAGQVLYALISKRLLSTTQFASVITWQTAYSAIGLTVAGPVAALTIVRSTTRGESDAHKIKNAGLVFALLFGLLAVAIWLAGGVSQISPWQMMTASMCLLSGSAIQVLSAFQRGVLSGRARWSLVCMQLLLEGLLRVALLMVPGLCPTDQKAIATIIVSWLAQLVALNIVEQRENTHLFKSSLRDFHFEHVRLFVPMWVAGLSIHGLISLTPNIASLFGASASAIGTLALGLFIVRIPITLSAAILTPNIQFLARQKSDSLISRQFRLAGICLLGAIVLVTALAPTLGVALMVNLTGDAGMRSRLTVLLFFVAALLLLFANVLHTMLLALEKLYQLSLGWLAGLSAFVIYVAITGGDIQHTVIALVCGACCAVCVLVLFVLLAIRALKRPTNVDQNGTLDVGLEDVK